MSVLICGSYAYDHIMVFPDRFKNHILPDKVHMINVSFLVPQMRREFGGTAGNIAYNLNALGEPALPMATVGMDFSAYSHWMQQCGVDERHITVVDEQYTGQAFITTDMDDNQITAFHPGAMSESHRNAVADAQGVELGIVSPDGRQGMIDHATQFAEAGIPFIFDPGQGMPMFDGNDLTQFVDQATWVAVNDYESALLSERTGLSLEQLAERVHGLIVTRGGEGSHIYADFVARLAALVPKPRSTSPVTTVSWRRTTAGVGSSRPRDARRASSLSLTQKSAHPRSAMPL